MKHCKMAYSQKLNKILVYSFKFSDLITKVKEGDFASRIYRTHKGHWFILRKQKGHKAVFIPYEKACIIRLLLEHDRMKVILKYFPNIEIGRA